MSYIKACGKVFFVNEAVNWEDLGDRIILGEVSTNMVFGGQVKYGVLNSNNKGLGVYRAP